MTRITTLLLASMAVLAACGGVSNPGIVDASADGADDGGNSRLCPITQPAAGSPCSSPGLQCSYSSNVACSGYWVCTDGAWRQEFPGAACNLDGGTTGGNCHGASGVIHRAQAAACASNAGADAGCNVVPHDQCLTDADCGAGQACLCQTPPPAGGVCPGGQGFPAGNACIPANCHVDSDCSPCGVCQADYWCGSVSGFYCQTPTDACFPASTDYDGNGCRFQSGQWRNTGPVACPG